ncbi:MAG: pilus assembly protein [Alphaproteobacteria bacterium]|nr:pilus assembly protein [Alphaproteobacteria bacterium]
MKKFFKLLFNGTDEGVAVVEFAIILPILVLTFVGLFEVTNFLYCNNKMNRTAQEISNIVTRNDVTKPQLDSMLKASVLIAQPFNFTQYGNVIVTSVSKVSSILPPIINWRDSYPGGTGGSRISPSSLPNGISLSAGQTVIFTEVFFNYQPVIGGSVFTFAKTNLYAVAAAVPRLGTMTTLPPS